VELQARLFTGFSLDVSSSQFGTMRGDYAAGKGFGEEIPAGNFVSTSGVEKKAVGGRSARDNRIKRCALDR